MSILIQQVQLNGKKNDILIEGSRIAAIGEKLVATADQVIDGREYIAVPAFYNTHTHAAMSLLRGYADNLELMEWLQKHIWSAEAKMGAEHIYWGTKLACLEMIKSGTVFFNDMYFFPQRIADAVREMGLRAAIGMTTLEASPNAELIRQNNEEIWANRAKLPPTITLTLAPHAIYTVCGETLAKLADFANRENLKISIHLSETAGEVGTCKQEHNGMTPVEYLDSLGFLSERVVAAHAVHLTDSDMQLMASRKAAVAFNPCSNMKLLSGLMPFRKMSDAGVNVTIGTDGNASNNSLSMFDEMKAAAITAELSAQTTTACTAEEIFTAATRNGARTFGLDAGEIAPDKLADLLLLDARATCLVPCHNLLSNLVYSADSSCVNTVICNGKILMRNRQVSGENEIIDKAAEYAAML